MIGWLISKVYYSVFYMEEKNIRNSHPISKIFFTIAAMLLVSRGDVPSVLSILTIVTVWVSREKAYTVLSAIILSMIPALWFSITGGVFYYFLQGETSLHDFFNIFTKTIGISLSIVFLAYSLTPYELSFFLWKTGFARGAIVPPFVWRLIPLSLVMVKDAYDVQKVKGESAWRSVGISIATGIESRDYIIEYNYHRLNTGIKRPFALNYSGKETIYLFAFSLFLLALYILL